MIGAVESMPIFTASAPKSESTESICATTNSGGRLKTPWTPTEFCAVTAVMTLIPNTRNAEKVLRSAWMPAPPPESEPAIVSALGILIRLRSIRRTEGALKRGSAYRPGMTSTNSPRTGARASRSRCADGAALTTSSNCFVSSRATTISAAPKTWPIASSVARTRCGDS